MSYKVIINTENYKKKRCSKKNWENGTMNDYMEALNNWSSTENNLNEVLWRIGMFSGSFVKGANRDPKWFKWKEKSKNKITYYDKLCEFDRTSDIEGYGFKQGYFDVNKVIDELKENGVVQIPFKWLYDKRKYYKGLDNCYMEIKKNK